MLSPAHLITLTNLTDDFRAEALFVSREFMESMDPVDIINVRTRYGVKLYSQPVIKFTPQEVEFIYEMLYSRARALLQENKMSIQEIATYLHFSDQSSFGKFFHRHSGVSPKEYRNRELSALK